jgi:hypothetical protein
MRAESVAVVLISKDEANIAESLRLLQPMCENVGARCVVVDASEGRLDYIRIENLWVEWIDFEKPFWRSTSIPNQRNLGVRVADCDIVAFCDAGGRPSPGWLNSLVGALRVEGWDYVCGPIIPTSYGALGIFNDLPTGSTANSAPTANVAFTRDAFERVSGFDERFNYGSDIDFQQRLMSAGTPCFVVNEAKMEMPWGDSDVNVRRSWRWGRGAGRNFRYQSGNRIAFLRRHPMLITWDALMAYTLGTLAAVLSTWQILFALPWAGLVLAWIVRHRTTLQRHLVARDHLVQGIAFLYEICSHPIPLGSRIGLIGYDPMAEAEIIEQCVSSGNSSEGIIWLSPLSLVVRRLRGMRLFVLLYSAETFDIQIRKLLFWSRVLRFLLVVDFDEADLKTNDVLGKESLKRVDGILTPLDLREINQEILAVGMESKGSLINRLALRAIRLRFA